MISHENIYQSFFDNTLCYINIAKDYIVFLFPSSKLHAADPLVSLTSKNQATLALLSYNNILNYKSQEFNTFSILSITYKEEEAVQECTKKVHHLIIKDNKIFKEVIKTLKYRLFQYQRQNLDIHKLYMEKSGKCDGHVDIYFNSVANFQKPIIKVMGPKCEVTSILLAGAVRCSTSKHTLAPPSLLKNDSDGDANMTFDNGNCLLTSNVTFRMGTMRAKSKLKTGTPKLDAPSSSLIALETIDVATWRWGNMDVRKDAKLQLWYGHSSVCISPKFLILLIDLMTTTVRHKIVNIPDAHSALTQDIIEIELVPLLMSESKKTCHSDKIVFQFFLGNQELMETWFLKLKILSRMEARILRRRIKSKQHLADDQTIVDDVIACATDSKITLSRPLVTSNPISLCELSRVYIYYNWQKKYGRARFTPHCTMVFSRSPSSNYVHGFHEAITTLHIAFIDTLDLKQFIDRLLIVLKYQRNIGIATPAPISHFRPLRI